MQNSFKKSVAILVKAYLGGTLNSMNCAACAVGNLVAGYSGYSICNHPTLSGVVEWQKESGEAVSPSWQIVRAQFRAGMELSSGPGLEQVQSTGYSPLEIAVIECAFEDWGMTARRLGFHLTAAPLSYDEEFDGLMRVVDVLADIHGIDLTQAAEAKLLFVKA